MKPKVIKNEAEYQTALRSIDKIFDNAVPGTPKGEEFELLTLLVEYYEESNFPIPEPDPITAIKFRMEQERLRPKDLIPLFGSAGKVSEVLAGRRQLSVTMMRNVRQRLGIPADVLLGVGYRDKKRKVSGKRAIRS